MKQGRLSRKAGWDPSDDDRDAVNPLENLANLSDVMLVLAVGILCALLVYMQIDFSQNTSGNLQITEDDQIDITIEPSEGSDSAHDYHEYGTLYQDEDGNFYLQTTQQKSGEN